MTHFKRSDDAPLWARLAEDHADVVIHAGDGGIEMAHAPVLAAAASPALLRMLSHAHGAETDAVHLFLSEVSIEEVRRVLDFIYGRDRQDLWLPEYWKSILGHSDSLVHVPKMTEKMSESPVKSEEALESLKEPTTSFWDDEPTNNDPMSGGDDDEKSVDYDDCEMDVKESEDVETPAPPKVIKLKILARSQWNCVSINCSFKSDFNSFMKHVRHSHSNLSRQITCLRCGQSFENKDGFLVHQFGLTCALVNKDETNKSEWFSCQECDFTCFGFRNLEIHVNLQHLDESGRTLPERWCLYNCEVCFKSIHSLQGMRNHQKVRHELHQGNFKEHFTTALRRHSEMPEPKLEYNAAMADKTNLKPRNPLNKFYCKICDQRFACRVGFAQHIKRLHEDDTIYECKTCQMRCATIYQLKRHIRYECGKSSGNVPCPQCNRCFKNLAAVGNHVTMVHNKDSHKVFEKVKLPDGKVKFLCDICGKGFPHNSHVIRHKMGVHQDKDAPKKYVCKFKGCSYQTNVDTNFKEHEMGVHGDLTLVCDQCGQGFKCPAHLKRHTISKHSNLQLMCEHCPKTFTNLVSLKYHAETHSERNRACPECGKLFNTRRALYTHKLTHNAARNFECDFCTKSFKTKRHLQRHEKENCKIKKKEVFLMKSESE